MIFEPLNFFKRSLMSIAVLLLISMTLVSNIQASGPWKLSKEEDDIQVYLRNTPNSPGFIIVEVLRQLKLLILIKVLIILSLICLGQLLIGMPF